MVDAIKFDSVPRTEFDVTIADIVNAIEENGLTQVKGTYIQVDPDTGKAIGACAIGQAAVNLSISWNAIYRELRTYRVPKRKYGLGEYIIHLNDQRGYTFAQIAAAVRKNFKRYLGETITFSNFERAVY